MLERKNLRKKTFETFKTPVKQIEVVVFNIAPFYKWDCDAIIKPFETLCPGLKHLMCVNVYNSLNSSHETKREIFPKYADFPWSVRQKSWQEKSLSYHDWPFISEYILFGPKTVLCAISYRLISLDIHMFV